MSTRRDQLMSRLYGDDTSVEERVLLQLTVERICEDMSDFYQHFYALAGPGAIVFVPEAKEEEDSMFYLTVDDLANAIDDFRSKEMDEPAEMMQKAIVRAEALNPDDEAVFLIQDESTLSLIHYNKKYPVIGPVKA